MLGKMTTKETNSLLSYFGHIMSTRTWTWKQIRNTARPGHLHARECKVWSRVDAMLVRKWFHCQQRWQWLDPLGLVCTLILVYSCVCVYVRADKYTHIYSRISGCETKRRQVSGTLQQIRRSTFGIFSYLSSSGAAWRQRQLSVREK